MRFAPLHAPRSRRLACEPLEPRLLLADTPLITEFLAANDRTLEDEDGDDSDWIEIYNPASTTVDLGGWYLTDNPRDLDKWRFPSMMLGPSEFLVVFASDKNRARAGSELHTNFKLDADGEYVALVAPDGSIASEFMPGGHDFPPQQTDVSYGLSMSVDTVTPVPMGASARIHVPASDALDDIWIQPDFDDASWDVGASGVGYETSPSPTLTDLIETEVPAGTTSVYIRVPFMVSDPSAFESLTLRMHYDDGFVAYLNGQLVASANAPAEPQWDSTAVRRRPFFDPFFPFEGFPLEEFRGALRPGENVLAIHGLNIALDRTNYPDLFILPELQAIDAVLLDDPAGQLPKPTPGLPNGTVVAGFVEAPTMTADRGFYEEPIQVALSSPTPNAEIRYTTDGSAPTATTGTAYVGPLTIDRTTTLRAAAFRSGYAPSPVATQTYIFIEDVVRQDFDATVAAGFPPTWGETPADYGLDPDVIGPGDLFEGVYAATLRDDLQALPTMSLAIEVDEMFGPEGIYTHPIGQGANWERAASVELVDPANREEFHADVALRIHGGASRGRLKKSLRLLFKGDYGPPTLQFPLFGTDAAQEFNTLVLRMNFNDGFLDGGAKAQYARDEFARRTQLAMGWPSAHGRYIHLYINGIYWGLYNPVERPDAAFTSSYYGGDREEWDIVHPSPGKLEATDGNLDAWQTFLTLAEDVSNASGPAEADAAYMRLQGLNPDGTDNPQWESYLDIDNYVDYLIVNYFIDNTDWPYHNWYAARRRGPESHGFVFHVWDAEWTLNHRFGSGGNRIGASPGGIDLRNSEEFRIRFADRVQKHLSPGGALYVNPAAPHWDPAHPENNIPAARYVEVTNEVRRGLVAESARWGDAASEVPITPNEQWETERNVLLRNYFPFRSRNVQSQLRSAGLNAVVETPAFSRRGGDVFAGYQVELTPALATDTIYYTLDGSDPRSIGGGISPAAIEYSGPITLTDDAVIRIRALRELSRDIPWSALDEVAFRIVPSQAQLTGDFDGNGIVEQSDLDLVLSHWGMDATRPPASWIHDLPDGLMDQEELDRVLIRWGATVEARPTADVARSNPASSDTARVARSSPPSARLPNEFAAAAHSPQRSARLLVARDAAFRSLLISDLAATQLR